MSTLLELIAKVKADRNTPNCIIEVIVVAPGPPGEGPIEVERFLWGPAQAALISERSENVITPAPSCSERNR
jgi:hypothetical protein